MWQTPTNVEFPLKVTDAHILWLHTTRVRAHDVPSLGSAGSAVLADAHMRTGHHISCVLLVRAQRHMSCVRPASQQKQLLSDATETNTVRLLQYVPVRRLAFAADTRPEKRNSEGLEMIQPDVVKLHNYAWNKFRHISWAIAYHLEVSR